jgi:hypothetical protein
METEDAKRSKAGRRRLCKRMRVEMVVDSFFGEVMDSWAVACFAKAGR